MNKLLRSIFILSLLFSLPVQAKLANEAEMDAALNKFMGLLKQEKSNEAAEGLMKHWPQQDGAALATLRTELLDGAKVNGDRFGKILATETVKSCKVGKFLYKAQTIIKYERGFVYWNFTFYNPSTGWELNAYRFDNKNFVPLTAACE